MRETGDRARRAVDGAGIDLAEQVEEPSLQRLARLNLDAWGRNLHSVPPASWQPPLKVHCQAVDPGGRGVLVGSDNGTIALLDATTGRALEKIRVAEGGPVSVLSAPVPRSCSRWAQGSIARGECCGRRSSLPRRNAGPSRPWRSLSTATWLRQPRGLRGRLPYACGHWKSRTRTPASAPARRQPGIQPVRQGSGQRDGGGRGASARYREEGPCGSAHHPRAGR